MSETRAPQELRDELAAPELERAAGRRRRAWVSAASGSATPARPGGTDGLRDVSPHERDPDDETPPEQSTGNPEDEPGRIPPKAGYPSEDPRWN